MNFTESNTVEQMIFNVTTEATDFNYMVSTTMHFYLQLSFRVKENDIM